MSWTPNALNLSAPEKPAYDHGYSEEEVIRIKEEFKKLEIKVANNEEISLEEFSTIVVPHCRINRTEEFIIKKEKEKAISATRKTREPKEKVEKLPKVKKLTKKEINARKERLQKLIMQKAAGIEYSEEDKEFLTMMQVEFE